MYQIMRVYKNRYAVINLATCTRVTPKRRFKFMSKRDYNKIR